MYKNNNKLLITLFIWMFLAGNGFIWAFIFCGVGTSELSGLDDPLPYRIVYLFLAAVNIGFIVLCGVKYTSLLAVNQINSFFAADEDGYVPLADLSKALSSTSTTMHQRGLSCCRISISLHLRCAFTGNLRTGPLSVFTVPGVQPASRSGPLRQGPALTADVR